MNRQEQGRWAEQAACRYLQAQGLRLRARNWRCRAGEIDLIMATADSLVFVEVRYRKPSGFGDGAASVTPSKQRKLIRAAWHYLQNQRCTNHPCRFDVISIGPRHTEWIRDAFQA